MFSSGRRAAVELGILANRVSRVMISRRAPIDEGLAQLLSPLAERQRQVIELRYGLQGVEPLTLQEVGMRLSLTREGVRNIQDKGISRLRDDNAHYAASFIP